MMKASQDRLGSDDADALNRSVERGIFMSAVFTHLEITLAEKPASVSLINLPVISTWLLSTMDCRPALNSSARIPSPSSLI